MLYLVVKRLLFPSSNSRIDMPKLILMSATFNTELFANYFVPVSPPDSIFVGVQRFPVDIYYLEDIWKNPAVQEFPIPYSQASLQRLSYNMGEAAKRKAVQSMDIMIQIVVAVCCSIIKHHHQHRSNTGNCVLIFLPGIFEIEEMFEAFDETNLITKEQKEQFLELCMLHSLMDRDEQMTIFSDMPPSVTRIILATNIAESSVTIPLVRFSTWCTNFAGITINIFIHCAGALRI